MIKPANKTIDTRRAEHWPTAKAKARYRRQNRRQIARDAQQERDRETRAAG